MDIEYIEESNKPIDWPANTREYILDKLCDCVEAFRNDPSYRTREALVSWTNQHDLNQSIGCGMYRVTEYEVGIINFLYTAAKMYQINSLMTYLYDIITQVTRMQKIASWCTLITKIEESPQIPSYEKSLLLPLKLYYFAYQKFTIEKEKSFAEQLRGIVTDILSGSQTKDEIEVITYAYTAMLFDISHMYGRKREKLWEFTREELYELLKLEAKLLRMNHQPANISPTKGVLMIQISNFILKSRHGYNEDYICKYLPVDVAKASIVNRQIWMKKTELLNDEREQRVIPELFEDVSWIKYQWAKDIDFSATRTYYVSSFSKAINTEEMHNNYGECLYGYKNDVIVDLIGPICMHSLRKRPGTDPDLPDTIQRPVISQVITFDVLYDIAEAKEELQYLLCIIDMFELTNDEKKQFLQEILQYWILSVKDSKWQNERERRYVLFLYDDYKYKETEFDDTFLKVKTSLFLTPDFILGDNPSRPEIERQLAAKRRALYSKPYLFCKNCLAQDHDAEIYGQVEVCPVCGSKDIKIIFCEEL